MHDTNTFIKPLNDSKVVFIVGSPTVTFNENVTVYSYPKQTIVFEVENNENNENTKIQTVKTRNIFKKLVSKISSFRI